MTMKSIKKAIVQVIVGGALLLVLATSSTLVGNETSTYNEIYCVDSISVFYHKPGAGPNP